MDPTDATQSSESQRQGLPGDSGTLNVILHGVFVIEVQDEITVYIPNMGTDHVYRAGTWLAETTLVKGDFRLEGVSKGPSNERPFDPAQNIVLEGVQVKNPSSCDRVYATLHFPLPDSVRSLSRLSIPPDGIGGDSRDKIAPDSGTHGATVNILTYRFTSDSDLRLGRHPWEPVFDEGFVNLHILAEPDQIENEDHIRCAFQMSMGLFSGVNLSLRKPTGRADLQAESAEIPAGVHPLEVQSLLTRQQWLQVLGRSIKEHRDLNGFWDFPTAFGDDGSCLTGGIRQIGKELKLTTEK